jgi:hypothetical protein
LINRASYKNTCITHPCHPQDFEMLLLTIRRLEENMLFHLLSFSIDFKLFTIFFHNSCYFLKNRTVEVILARYCYFSYRVYKTKPTCCIIRAFYLSIVNCSQTVIKRQIGPYSIGSTIDPRLSINPYLPFG